MAAPGSQVKRSQAPLRLGLNFGVLVDQGPDGFQVSALAADVQQSHPVQESLVDVPDFSAY